MRKVILSNTCAKRLERLRPKGKQASKFLETILKLAESNGTIDDALQYLGWDKK